MKDDTIIGIGLLGIVGYFLLKGGLGDLLGGGGGNGGGSPPENPPSPPITDPNRAIHEREPRSQQKWTGVSYGQPGQPSKQFAYNTLIEGLPFTSGIGKATPVVTARSVNGTVAVIAKPLLVSKGVKPLTIFKPSLSQKQASFAAQAILANAPPRVVAKIKGGSWY